MATILTNSEIAEYARTLASSFRQGASIADTLESMSVSAASRTLRDATARIKSGLMQGKQINQTMSETGLFPDVVVKQVAQGEQAGMLDFTFAEIAASYEQTNT